MKNKKHHTVKTVPKSNSKIAKKAELKSIPITHIHKCIHDYWLETHKILDKKQIEIMLWIIYITIYNLLENSVYKYTCKLICVDILTIDIKLKF